MSIKLQLKNFAKLLLVGAVLFVICSSLSKQAIRCASAKISDACQADLSELMFANADKQAKPESPSYLLAGDSCVKAAMPPVAATPKVLGAIVGDTQDLKEDEVSRNAISEYEIEEGDTVSSLAEEFNISADTILWANNMAKGASLKPGQKIIIPPTTGIVYYVASGDTAAEIAKKYQAKLEDIIAYNELSGEDDIFVGDVLMVPGGKMPQAAPKKVAQSASQAAASGVDLSGNYFLCPVGSPCRLTQGLHFRNAVDLTAGYCGAPIYAAASGTVIKAKLGWSGGAGNNVAISHMGGSIITHYYHLQTITVSQGQEVKKGDVIGFEGATGISTGCHLHFEVIGAANPFVK